MAQSMDEMITNSDIWKLGSDYELSLLPEPEKRAVWCPIISVDDHAFESRDTFSRVPAKYEESTPKCIDVDGRPAWLIGDQTFFFTGMDGASGRPMAEWRSLKMRYEDYRQGIWDIHARVSDMDLNGVWASLCFPSIVWGFSGSTLARIPDRDAAYACVQAYNDWMVEDWCGAYPDRFIPCQIPFLADPELAAKEVRRNAARGVHCVTFSENPEGLGFPSIFTDHWEPFLAACAETETTLNLHLGSSGSIHKPSSGTPGLAQLALFPVNGIETVVDWVYSKIPIRYPDIKIVLSEAGVSWVPMVIERLRRSHSRSESEPDTWTSSDPDPVELLHRNFWFTSIEDPSAFRQLDIIGEDHVMVEVDYPHADSSWPDSQELFRSEMDFLSRQTIEKLCYRNAATLFHQPEPPESMKASATLFET
jgi:predicted TIM-barrel fold metal-dependent hydrolase